MKKKVFAVFAAALTALCCLAAPSAAAESQYQMGDISRDGKVSLKDAQFALNEYTITTLGKHPLGTYLDDEQRALAIIVDRSQMSESAQDHVMLEDAYMLLIYYVYDMGNKIKESTGVIEFYQENPDIWKKVEYNPPAAR